MELKEMLLGNGFELINGDDGRYYEFYTENQELISKILGDDFLGDEQFMGIYVKEDFSNIKINVDFDDWYLTEEDLVIILNKL